MSEQVEKKFICNYCFVMECMDLAKTPEAQKKALAETKCTGVSHEDSIGGRACTYAANLIKEHP